MLAETQEIERMCFKFSLDTLLQETSPDRSWRHITCVYSINLTIRIPYPPQENVEGYQSLENKWRLKSFQSSKVDFEMTLQSNCDTNVEVI